MPNKEARTPASPDPDRPRGNRKFRWMALLSPADGQEREITLDTDAFVWTDLVEHLIERSLLRRDQVGDIVAMECVWRRSYDSDIAQILYSPAPGLTRFRVGVNANFTRQTVYEVDAATAEEAAQLAEDGDQRAEQMYIDDDESFTGQEARFVLDSATGEETMY